MIRRPCGMFEFHCVLVDAAAPGGRAARRRLPSLLEHIDLGFDLRRTVPRSGSSRMSRSRTSRARSTGRRRTALLPDAMERRVEPGERRTFPRRIGSCRSPTPRRRRASSSARGCAPTRTGPTARPFVRRARTMAGTRGRSSTGWRSATRAVVRAAGRRGGSAAPGASSPWLETPSMPELPQTNMQLCRQVVALGWSDDDLDSCGAPTSSRCGCTAGSSEPTGRRRSRTTWASPAHSLRAARGPTLVVGGLVHSAYFLGEFGSGRLAIDPDKRTRAGRHGRRGGGGVGPRLHRAAEWNRRRSAHAAATTPRRCLGDADVVAMRLANEVDEMADASAVVLHDRPDLGLDGARGTRRCSSLAGAYGLDGLA